LKLDIFFFKGNVIQKFKSIQQMKSGSESGHQRSYLSPSSSLFGASYPQD
jgi:hypothetical protein